MARLELEQGTDVLLLETGDALLLEAERLSPDALLEQVNLSGALADIQDDPDSPDGNWLTYVANNLDTVTRVGFPTPTGSPTQGADLQEFKIWVRKQPGTGTPAVSIDLYENGVLVANLMAATSVTSPTGELFSATWDATQLGTADGSVVECRIFGQWSNGAPTARCTVEVGAVEWNVTYTEEGVPPGWNKIFYTEEPPTPSAWNQVKQDAGSGYKKILYT